MDLAMWTVVAIMLATILVVLRVDGVDGGGSTPAAPPSSGAGTPATPAASPAASAPAPSSAAAPAPSSPPSQTFRDMAKDLLPSGRVFKDDAEAISYMRQQAAEQSRLAGVGQQVYPYLSEFQQWQQEKAAEAQAKAKQDQQTPYYEKWWKAPEYKPDWSKAIYKDPETGRLSVRDGYPPDILNKALTYSSWLDQQQAKFWENPIQFMQEPIMHLAQHVAQQIVDQRLGEHQQRLQAQSFVNDNADWLFQTKDGNFVYDANGNRQLNEWGQRFHGYVGAVERRWQSMGIHPASMVEVTKDMALNQIKLDYLLAQKQQAQAPAAAAAAGDASKEAFLRQAAVSAMAATPTPGANTVPAPAGQARVPLEQRMMAEMAKVGIKPTDELRREDALLPM